MTGAVGNTVEEEYETEEETSQTGHPYHRGPDKTVKSQAAKAYEGPSKVLI